MNELLALVRKLACLLVLVFYVPCLIGANCANGMSLRDAMKDRWREWLNVWREA